MFIDASNDFDKVKTQNKQLPEHIDKILAAFTGRINLDKYAKVASMADIKANDFNLNIPRYVDTFEAEAEIDLNAVANELRQLEQASVDVDAQIAAFCAELGIENPFAEVQHERA